VKSWLSDRVDAGNPAVLCGVSDSPKPDDPNIKIIFASTGIWELLGKSNLEVSAIGLGCMGLNFSYDHPSARKRASS
jgi:hypothetical protein